MWRSFFILALLTSSAFAQEELTAYEALRVVGTQFNRAAMQRIVSVTGSDGASQPARWRILISDRRAPGGVREFEVAHGRIVSQTTPAREGKGAAGATINTAKLNLDSSGAFNVASHAADQSHLNFSYASYVLRTNERGIPVWIVTLQDENHNSLGTIYIGANKGTVTRVEGMYRGANMAQVEEARGNRHVRASDEEPTYDSSDSENSDDGDENVVKAEIKRRFRQTRRDAERIFERVGESFDSFFNRG
ncbi:MAG: hypothetical protein ACR2HH_10510 [Chthoniobacterales bacterium]